ncbi:hypothetical protein [Neisseria musculi]|nr:hypothetical protein [Neisseria musculi]
MYDDLYCRASGVSGGQGVCSIVFASPEPTHGTAGAQPYAPKPV